MTYEHSTKKFYLSKTFWVNFISILSILSQLYLGFVIDPELQILALSIINMLLRAITKSELDWHLDRSNFKQTN